MNSSLTQLLALIGCGLLVWYSFRFIKKNPGLFSKKNLGDSFFTLGILALGLIAVIALCVMFLRHT
jgi:hypothetical protein